MKRARTLCLPAALFLALALALAASSGSAQSLAALFRDGNAAYFRGDHAGAARGYQRLIEAGVRDADVYFNAATAHARAGALGRAVLELERCLWIRPSDEGCAQALSVTEAELGKRRAQREGEATVRARPPLSEALLRPFSADALAVLVLVLNALLVALVLALRSGRAREGLRLALTLGAPLTGLLLVLAGTGLALKAGLLDEGAPAVVLRDTPLLEGPDPRAEARVQALEGQRARLQGRDGGYLEARLDGGGRGWIKASDVARIRPD